MSQGKQTYEVNTISFKSFLGTIRTLKPLNSTITINLDTKPNLCDFEYEGKKFGIPLSNVVEIIYK